MNAREIEGLLREALVHLHDPDYVPPAALCELMGCGASESGFALQSAIIRVIEGLKPQPDTPCSALAKRLYDVLYNRFVLGLTQEETADRLHLSLASVRRAQRSATHALARLLWEQRPVRETEQPVSPEESKTPSFQQPVVADWRSQVKRDLAALQESAPGAVAKVSDVVNSVVELERVLSSRRKIELVVEPIAPHLAVAVHPAVLRQILIVLIGQLNEYSSRGGIRLWVEAQHGDVALCVAGRRGAKDPPMPELVQEILSVQGGRLRCVTQGAELVYSITLPSAGDVTVLVVDDNPDMIYFYRRCVEGTRYRVVHEQQGRRVFEAIESYRPDIVVLDIMLPDVDGWQLLADLHHSPFTRSIPVLVCSVIREESLARELGALQLLPKPIDYADFIRALDRAVVVASRAKRAEGVTPDQGTQARTATAD